MRTHYTPDELDGLRDVLAEAYEEATKSGTDLSVEVLASRLFKAAEAGYETVDELKAKMLGRIPIAD